MDKHTATHICTYDTHVDRMKDGKNSVLNKSPVTCFNLSFIPLLLMLASLALTGFRKNNKRFPSKNRTRRGGGSHAALHIQKFSQSLLAMWTWNLLWGFVTLSLLFKISLDLKGGEAKAPRGIAVQLKAHYSLSPAPCWVEKAWLPLVDTSTGS